MSASFHAGVILLCESGGFKAGGVFGGVGGPPPSKRLVLWIVLGLRLPCAPLIAVCTSPGPRPLSIAYRAIDVDVCDCSQAVVAALDPPRAPMPPHAAKQSQPRARAYRAMSMFVIAPRQWSLHWIRLGHRCPLTRLSIPHMWRLHTYMSAQHPSAEAPATAAPPLFCASSKETLNSFT